MSQEVLTLTVIVVWVLTGLCLGIVMGRRGYSGFGWGVIGTVLGPLGVLAAVAFRVPSRPRIKRGRVGRFGPGDVRVLAAVDGSSASMEAAAYMAGVLGPRIGRFTIATVIPYDATDEVVREGDDHLAAACETVRHPLARIDALPSTVVLRGAPADALRAYATAEDFDLLVIGPHGQGLSKAVLGSAAASLVRTSPIPVVVGASSSGVPADSSIDDLIASRS